MSEIKFAGTTGPTGTSGTRYIRYNYPKCMVQLPELIFSLKTIGVIYFWKAGDTRISEIKFAGTTGPTGTSGTRYIRYPRYLKTPNAWFYDKPDVNEITDLTESGKLNQVPGICD